MSGLIQGHRIFLHAHHRPVPGYVNASEPGTVMLPLKLDGSMKAVKTGYASSDPEVLGAYLEQTIHTHHIPSFVNRKNWFVLYENKEAFESVHRPSWIKSVTQGIKDTVDEYAAGEGRLISQLTPYNLADELQMTCDRLTSYVDSFLYMGTFDELRIGLEKTSHEFFCYPLENAMPMRISMLGWLFSIDHAFYRRLRPRFGVEDHQKNRRYLKDSNIFDSFEVTLTREDGVEHTTVLSSHERSTEIFILGSDGNISRHSTYQPAARFEQARLHARSKAAHIIRSYLFAELNISAEDIFRLSEAKGCPLKRTYDFLVHEKGAPPHLIQAMTKSLLNVINDIAMNPRVSDYGTA